MAAVGAGTLVLATLYLVGPCCLLHGANKVRAAMSHFRFNTAFQSLYFSAKIMSFSFFFFLGKAVLFASVHRSLRNKNGGPIGSGLRIRVCAAPFCSRFSFYILW